MVQAKKGDVVKVNYTGKLQDGTIFDTSINREPLQLTLGEGKEIPGFEEAIVGMNPGESKTVKVPAEKAYGSHNEEMVLEIDRNKLREDLHPKVGQKLKFHKKDGKASIVTVTGVSASSITIDANHPLAGKDLTFDINLKEIIKP